MAVFCLAICLTGCSDPPPSDAQLIANFKTHRVILEKLREEICVLAPQTIWTDSNNSKPRLPAKKLAAFLPFMAKVGATRIAAIPAQAVPKARPCDVEITLWSAGILDSGDTRSFEYAPHLGKDDLVVPNLARVDVAATIHVFNKKSGHGHRTYLRHLGGKWWLVRDYWQ
jgi:hypothetical protein